MITAIKLFYQGAMPMVALYGAANEHGDGWQCNLPAKEVLAGDPSSLPAEQQLLLSDAEKRVGWTAAFQARLAKETPPMRMPELVNAISNSTGVLAAIPTELMPGERRPNKGRKSLSC